MHDQDGNFRKFKKRTAAIMKITLSPYLSRELSDFKKNLVRRYKFPFWACKFDKNI